MSIVLHHSRARGTDKLVLLGIANHAGDGGSWPRLETLARYANVTERAVSTSVGKLRAMGELIVDVNGGGTHRTRGDNRPNLYQVTVACPITCDRTLNHRPRPYPGPDPFQLAPPVDNGTKQPSSREQRDEAGFVARDEAGFVRTSPRNQIANSGSSVTGPRARANPLLRAAALQEARDQLRGWCAWPRAELEP